MKHNPSVELERSMLSNQTFYMSYIMPQREKACMSRNSIRRWFSELPKYIIIIIGIIGSWIQTLDQPHIQPSHDNVTGSFKDHYQGDEWWLSKTYYAKYHRLYSSILCGEYVWNTQKIINIIITIRLFLTNFNFWNQVTIHKIYIK